MEGGKPSARFQHSAVVGKRNGEQVMLVFGGIGEGSKVQEDLWEYSFSNNKWNKLKVSGSLLPRSAHSSFLSNQLLFLVGGTSPNPQLPNSTEIDLGSSLLFFTCFFLFLHVSKKQNLFLVEMLKNKIPLPFDSMLLWFLTQGFPTITFAFFSPFLQN